MTKETGTFSNIVSEYEYLNECCGEMTSFANAVLAKDIGPCKKGQKVSSIWFMLDTGKLQIFIGDSAESADFECSMKIDIE